MNGQMNYPMYNKPAPAPVQKKKSLLPLISMIGTILFAAAAFGMLFLPVMSISTPDASGSYSTFDFTYLTNIGQKMAESPVYESFVMIETVVFAVMAFILLVVVVCKLLQKFLVARIFALIITILGTLGTAGYLVLMLFSAAILGLTTGSSTMGIGPILMAVFSFCALVFAILGMFGNPKRKKAAPASPAPSPYAPPAAPVQPMQSAQPMSPMAGPEPMPQSPAADPMPAMDPMQSMSMPGADPMQSMPPMDPMPVADPLPPMPVMDPLPPMPPMDSVQQPVSFEANQVPVVAPTPLGDFQVDPASATIPVFGAAANPDFDPDDPPTTVQEGGLIGLSGDYQGADIPMRSGEKILIGRDASVCNLVIGAETKDISRTHCSVKYDAYINCYKVIDMSSNGTFVNGQQLPKNQEAQLPAGTVISLGRGANKFKLKG